MAKEILTNTGLTPSEVIALFKQPLPDKAYGRHTAKSYLTTISPAYTYEALNKAFGMVGWGWGIRYNEGNVILNEGATAKGKPRYVATLLKADFWYILGDNEHVITCTGSSDNDNWGDALAGMRTSAIGQAIKLFEWQAHIFKNEPAPSEAVEESPNDDVIFEMVQKRANGYYNSKLHLAAVMWQAGWESWPDVSDNANLVKFGERAVELATPRPPAEAKSEFSVTEGQVFNRLQSQTGGYFNHLAHLKNTAAKMGWGEIPLTDKGQLADFGETVRSRVLQKPMAETQPDPGDTGEAMTHQTRLRLNTKLSAVAPTPEQQSKLLRLLDIPSVDELTDSRAITVAAWLEKNSEWASRLANL